MAWHRSSDATELWHAAGPWLALHAVENAPLLAEIGHLLATDPEPDGLACGWWADEGTVGGAYLRAPRHNPLLTRMPRAAIVGLTSVLPHPDALGVPEVIAADLLDAWGAVGTRLAPARSFTVQELHGRPAPPTCAGRPRTAGPDDRALLHRWCDQLMAGLPGDPSDRAYVVDDPLATGALALWEVDGEPVAMCSRSRVLGDTVRMGASYAPGGHEEYADAAFGAAAVEARRHARHVTVLAMTGDEHEAARLASHGFVPAATRVSLTSSGDG